jgi:hypothetical protein
MGERGAVRQMESSDPRAKKRVLARRDKNPPSWLSERGFPCPETHSRNERIEPHVHRTLGSAWRRGSAGTIELMIVQFI